MRHEAEESELRPKLLIVEDDAAMREVWATIFGSRGWDVAVAATVAEGLELLDHAPDYLILDLALPDGSGGDILRRVRGRNLKTRVAVTTAEDDPERLREIEALRPEAIFEKSVHIADVWRVAG